MSTINQLLARAVIDQDLAAALVSDPEGTLQAQGITPTAGMVDALRRIDPATLSRLASAFGDTDAAAAAAV